MDLSEFKKKITPFIDKTKPFVNEAKIFGGKALNFTQNQAKNTPIFIKTEEEYNVFVSGKRTIFIAYDDRDPINQEIVLRSPIWATKSWMDAAEIRYFSIANDENLTKLLNIQGPIEMRISYIGEEFFRTNDLTEMKKWWDNRCYKKDDSTEEPVINTVKSESEIYDPLAQTK